MRIRKLDASVDRQVIMGMVVSDKYLKAVKPIYHPDFVMAPYVKTVAGWCLDYLEKYDKAPGADIQNIFNSKRREGSLDEEQADLIEDFLSGLSEEYQRGDKFNSDYLLDETERLWRQRNLKYLAEDLSTLLADGDLEEAEACLGDFKKVQRPVAQGFDALDDMERYQRAFENRKEPLFKMPGAYGEMVNPHLVRGGFVAFLGRMKIGKTWRLMDFGFRALRERCNVAMFHAGDLSEDDHIIRQGVHFSHKSNDARYCGELHIPELDCEINQRAGLNCPHGMASKKSVFDEDGEIDIEMIGTHKVCTRCKKERTFKGAVWWSIRPKVEPLTWREAWRNTEQWKKRHKSGRLKVSCHPNSSLTVQGIINQLDLWEHYEGYIPDVLILDYPDIMDKDDRRQEGRDVENTRWKLLRKLCQERHILLIVVTQTNRSGINDDPDATSVGEDKRKLDHVTACFGLNQNEQEEELGVIRISNLLVREGKREIGKQVRIIQSLETGQPYIASYYYYPKKKGKGA